MTRVKSQGYIEIRFTVVMKNFNRLGYDNGSSDSTPSASFIPNTFSTKSLSEALDEEQTSESSNATKKIASNERFQLGRRRSPIRVINELVEENDESSSDRDRTSKSNPRKTFNQSTIDLSPKFKKKTKNKLLSPKIQTVESKKTEVTCQFEPGTSGIKSENVSKFNKKDEINSSAGSFDEDSDTLEDETLRHSTHRTQVHISSPNSSHINYSPPVKLAKNKDPSPQKRRSSNLKDPEDISTATSPDRSEGNPRRRSTAFEAFADDSKVLSLGKTFVEENSHDEAESSTIIAPAPRRTMDLFSASSSLGPAPLPRKSLPALEPRKPLPKQGIRKKI